MVERAIEIIRMCPHSIAACDSGFACSFKDAKTKRCTIADNCHKQNSVAKSNNPNFKEIEWSISNAIKTGE